MSSFVNAAEQSSYDWSTSSDKSVSEKQKANLHKEIRPTSGDPFNHCDYKISNIVTRDVVSPTDKIVGKITRAKSRQMGLEGTKKVYKDQRFEGFDDLSIYDPEDH